MVAASGNNFGITEWLTSDPGLGVRGIHFECKRILGQMSDRTQTASGSSQTRHEVDYKSTLIMLMWCLMIFIRK